jgi:hypothetical protein
LVSWRLDSWCKSSWRLNDFFIKIQLNHNWNFERNWDVPLVLLEIFRRSIFSGINFIRFKIGMGEILNFEWFLSSNIQRITNNQVLKGKISWEHGHTWRSTVQFKYEKLGCPFGIVKKISMRRIQWNLFHKLWI